ncbi:hypothetical protein L9F63_023038, partial [Diploptera punctata]
YGVFILNLFFFHFFMLIPELFLIFFYHHMYQTVMSCYWVTFECDFKSVLELIFILAKMVYALCSLNGFSH